LQTCHYLLKRNAVQGVIGLFVTHVAYTRMLSKKALNHCLRC